MNKQLKRSRRHSVLGGVCGGLGDYFDIDPVIFRFTFFALLLAGGSSIFIYLLLMIVIPKEPLVVGEGKGSGHAEVNNFDSFQSNDLSKAETDSGTRLVFGLLLISAGVLFLLNNLVPYFRLQKLWPAILVIMGLGLLFQKAKSKEDTAGKV